MPAVWQELAVRSWALGVGTSRRRQANSQSANRLGRGRPFDHPASQTAKHPKVGAASMGSERVIECWGDYGETRITNRNFRTDSEMFMTAKHHFNTISLAYSSVSTQDPGDGVSASSGVFPSTSDGGTERGCLTGCRLMPTTPRGDGGACSQQVLGRILEVEGSVALAPSTVRPTLSCRREKWLQPTAAPFFRR